jgi:hypothetical protein
MYFFNIKEGIAISDTRPWFTLDGGKSWSAGDSSLIALSAFDLAFAGTNFGWIVSEANPCVTDAGFIARTTDGGKTWNYQDRPCGDSTGPPTPILLAIDLVDSLTAFAVGDNWRFSSPYVLSTTDGGINWKSKQFIGGGAACDVAFLDKYNGWFTGDRGRIWKTTDGGETWSFQNTNVLETLGNIIILRKEKIAYIFGGRTYGYVSYVRPFSLLRADLSDISEAKAYSENVSEEFYLSQNYPNPFNPTTSIGYGIPTNDLVTIKVFDLLGREITTLIEEKQTKGDHSVSWNATSFTSGIYFCRLQSGKFTKTKKLLFMK